MAQPHLEVFSSEYHMLKFFGEYLPKLDVDASARLAPFLYCYDRQLVLARNLYEFLTQIEEMTALGINTLASARKGASFLIFFNEKPKSPGKFLEDIRDLKVSLENVIPDDKEEEEVQEFPEVPLVQTTIVDQVQEVKEEDEVVENKPGTDSEKEKILAQAEALRDDSKKAAAKSALEEFALTHNISLSRAKTFDGMLEDLKAAL